MIQNLAPKIFKNRNLERICIFFYQITEITNRDWNHSKKFSWTTKYEKKNICHHEKVKFIKKNYKMSCRVRKKFSKVDI
jgi:hypothetical protein